MTYLEFYQAWLELMMQNNQTITEPAINCVFKMGLFSSQFLLLSSFFVMFSMMYVQHKKNITSWSILVISAILYISYTIFIIFYAERNPRCEQFQKPATLKILINSYVAPPYSWSKYPEKDYTVEEFEKNMATLSSNAISEQKTLKVSPEQIEQAKTVLENCLKNLPYDYQVNHSVKVRRCIADEETKRIFEQKDTENEIKKVEIYKDNFIKKLRNIH